MKKTHIICHMFTGVDGRLHPSRFTKSPDGDRSVWHKSLDAIYEAFKGDAWMVGRVTAQEMAKGVPHAPEKFEKPERPHHFARKGGKYAIAVDPIGKVHFAKSDIGGDHAVALLGPEVADSHLAELTNDGISYVIADTTPMNLAAMMDVLYRELKIERLLLEGGASLNNSFLAAGLVDELSVVIAPGIDGGRESEAIIEGNAKLQGIVELALKSVKQLDHGLVHLVYTVTPARS